MTENPIRIANKQLAETLLQLVDCLDYYGVDSFKRQLTEYANGKRSANIGDMLCVPLGRMQGTYERSYLKS